MTGPTDAAANRFRDAVIASPALQARLGACDRPESFEAEARAVAAELGLPICNAAALQAGPMSLAEWPGPGWLPVRSIATDDAPAFDWAWFGDRRLTDPFYADSVRQIASRPLSRTLRIRTDMDVLVAGAARQATLAPTGLIFHMSRCGSTLAAQMLAAVPHHIVVAEAEPIDAVVRWAETAAVPVAARASALRAIVAAFGRDPTGTARRYFLKLDAWHILSLPLYRAAFPDVPWLFLYRDPEEVMVSQMRMPGTHFGGGVAGLVPPDNGTPFTPEGFGARILARLLSAAADHHPIGGGMLVDYATLLACMTHAIPGHFGFVPDAAERDAMAAAALRDAKAPDRDFAADGSAKRAAVTPAIRAAVATAGAAPCKTGSIARGGCPWLTRCTTAPTPSTAPLRRARPHWSVGRSGHPTQRS